MVKQMGLSSGDIFNSKAMNKPKPGPSKSSESSDARERFSNAKSISSSQFHGTDAADARQTEETLSRYSGSKVGPALIHPTDGPRSRAKSQHKEGRRCDKRLGKRV